MQLTKEIQTSEPENKGPANTFTQMNFFEEKIIKQENKDKFEILGQVFQTYWIVRFEDKLLFVDQHAAHEKIKYENLLSSFHTGEIVSQTLQPPLVLHLTQKEETALNEYHEYFENLGKDGKLSKESIDKMITKIMKNAKKNTIVVLLIMIVVFCFILKDDYANILNNLFINRKKCTSYNNKVHFNYLLMTFFCQDFLLHFGHFIYLVLPICIARLTAL